jgi:NADH-quinone oxidoreductase subunit C
LSSADAPPTTTTDDAPAAEPEPVDEAREALVETLRGELGDALVAHQIRVQDDLWVRITAEAWGEAAPIVRRKLGFAYFTFLSAIDWKPSPFGRYEDAEVDEPIAEKIAQHANDEIVTGYAGGDTRFQVFARVRDIRTDVAHGVRDLTLKVDVPDDTLTVPTWMFTYAGADWHERETNEMFGIVFAGHPDLRHIYLPTEFEGYPLRKDFPLLARVVKPWPGIVDVEPMPGETADDEATDDATGGATGEAAEEGATS